MDGAFVNLMRGSRLKLYLGLDTDKYPGTFGADYTYLAFPVEEIETKSSTLKKASRKKKETAVEPEEEKNRTVLLRVKCGPLHIKKYKIGVACSASLYSATESLHFPSILEAEDNGDLLILATVNGDVDWNELGNCVRLYMYS